MKYTVFYLVLHMLVIFSSTSVAQWSNDSTVNTPISTPANTQILPTIVSDDSGGAIITWYDLRSGTNYDIYAQRINSAGVVQWTANGVAISTASSHQDYPTIVSDDSGGAIITWQDYRSGTNYDIYVQRINSAGVVQWVTDGVAISTAANSQQSPTIVSDGSGGAIITWHDNRSGSGSSADIYAQRINSAGVVQWVTDGVAISTAASAQFLPTIISDDSGGAIITWQDYRSGTNYDIYAQRINSAGVVQWVTDGVAISTAANSQQSPTIVSDGSGGAIITWHDARSGSSSSADIYAQRINSSGVVQWTANGVAISTAANSQQYPIIVSDGSGGAIITWYDNRSGSGVNYDIYAQRINSSGVVQWTANGAAISTAAINQQIPAIVSDGSGGAIITWQDNRSGNADIYTQRISDKGVVQWVTNGAAISTAANNQQSPTIVSDGSGGAIITWQDNRSGNADVYAQFVSRAGALFPVKEHTISSINDIPNDQGRKVRLRWQKVNYDTLGLPSSASITSYRLWRKIPATALASQTRRPFPSDILESDTLADYEYLLSVPAMQLPYYNAVVPTLDDSSATGTNSFTYIVTAHNNNGHYLSVPNSGYSVNNLGGSSQSELQPVAAPDEATPFTFELQSIIDMPNDQGGKLRLRWGRSSSDDLGVANPVMNYNIWRKIPTDQLAPVSSMKFQPSPSTESLSDYDFVMNVPSAQIPYYYATVPTLEDSNSTGTHRFTYVVSAHLSNIYYHDLSPPDSGYSVDNLSPFPPQSLTAQVLTGRLVILRWQKNRVDPDVRIYEVHRSTVLGFVPDPSTRIGETTDTMMTDGAPLEGTTNYYRIVTVDIHSNQSSPSPEAAAILQLTQSYSVEDKWNMLSIPLMLDDYTKTVVYPTAMSNAFAYEGGYVIKSTLTNGSGYWVKFNGSQSVSMTGYLKGSETIPVTEGWNLIGSISSAVDVAAVSSNPSGIVTSQFFGYSGGYQVATTIEPGKAYWVKVNQSGILTLSSQTSASSASTIRIIPTGEMPPPAPDDETSEFRISNIPSEFGLDQNHPNPFNPITVIKFQLPAESRVTLTVYDILGRDVARLVSEQLPAGEYSRRWFASDLPSGIYFYRLTAGRFTEVKKMLLLK